MLNKVKNNRTAYTIRWIARIVCLILTIGFLSLFIGEDGIKGFNNMNDIEKISLFFVPILFIVGFFISFKKELIGGIIIVLSVVGFNVLDMTSAKGFSGEIPFAFLLVPGILFILLSYFSNKRSSDGGNEAKFEERRD